MFSKLIVVSALFVAYVSGQTNYCDPTLCPTGRTHVACKYKLLSWNETACSIPDKALSTVSAADKQIILDLHNKIRRNVAKGLETRGFDGPQPSAANMREMVWNDELAALAQTLAQQCQFGHDQCRIIPSKTAGQNVFFAISSQPFESTTWANAVQDGWCNEVGLMTSSQVTSFMSTPPIYVIDNYAQLVWATTYEVGCGVIHYKAKDMWYRQIIVCNYGPAGNYKYQAMYKVGAPASACPAGTVPSDGLCASVNV